MRRSAFVFIAPLLFLAAGCGKAETPAKGPTPMTQSQTITTRPLCVGRFLIDVPADAKVVGTQTTTSNTAGTISMQTTVSKATFKSKMESNEAQLRRSPHQTEGSRLSEVLRPDEMAYIFRYRKNDVGVRAYQIDGYRWIESESILLTINSGASNDVVRTVIDEVKRGLYAVTPRDTWAIPTEPGFCFDHGFLPVRDSTFEATGVQLEFVQFPGLRIFMETRVHGPSPVAEPGLLERTDDALKLTDGSDKPSVLRKRHDRAVLFGKAEEVFLKQRREKHYSILGDLEMHGQDGALDKPDTAFSLVLDPPKDGSTQPEEEAVLRLWDAVIDSVRLRPGAL